MLNFTMRNIFRKITWRRVGSTAYKPIKVEAGKYFLLVVPVTTFCLGTWQVQRRTWKLNLIEELQKKIDALPVDLPEDLSKVSELEYRKVHVKGVFDHSKEVYIGPRSLITENGMYAGSKFQTSPESGNLVITPFYLPDRDVSILVNRGWVSKNKTNPETRLQGQVPGEISLTGIVRLSEKRPVFSPKNDPLKSQYYFRDIDEIARNCNTAPIMIDADYLSSVPGGPIGGQTRLTVRNEHVNYIITWYSLSAATAFMWYQKYIRGMRLA